MSNFDPATSQPPRRPQTPLLHQLRALFERLLAQHGMTRIALAAFAVGVFLQVCIVYAVLDDGGGGSASSPPQRPTVGQTPRAATPVSTALADRRDCNAIRNTDYRSDAERQWFIANCVSP